MEKKSRKSIIIGITSLFLVMLILVGLTYAYYRTRIIGNDSTDPSISVVSKKLEIKYNDGNSTVNMEGLIEPGFEYTKTFTVENTGDALVDFSIIFDNKINTFSRLEDWSYTFTKDGTIVATGTVTNATRQIVVAKEEIASKAKNTYTLVVTYTKIENVDQSEDMGKSLSFRVNINEAENLWDNAKEGTLLAAIKANNPTVHTNMDFESEYRFVDYSGANNEVSFVPSEEAGLALYEGNYYFRGEVDNNYVLFDEKLWRIVEINEYGIKLVSASKYVEGNYDDENNKIMDFRKSATYQDLKKWYKNNISEAAKEKTVEGKFSHLVCNSIENTICTDSMFASDYSYAGTLSFKDYLLASGLDMSYYSDIIESEPAWYGGYNYTYFIDELINSIATIGALDFVVLYDTGDIEFFRQDADYFFGSMTITYAIYLPVIHLNSNVTIQEGGNGTQATPYVIS